MIIYKATNLINEKVYIGKTSLSLSSRQFSHKKRALKLNSQNPFHCAIREFGLSNFKWEIIDNTDSDHKLNELEKYWISKCFSGLTQNGYNSTSGGDSGFIRFNDNSGIHNNFYGRKHSEETKNKISESRKGKGLGQTELQKLKCHHKGSDNGNTKINENTVIQVKTMLKNNVRNCVIQKTLNISKNTLQGIKRGSTWRHIEIC